LLPGDLKRCQATALQSACGAKPFLRSCFPDSWFRGFQISVFMVIYPPMADDRWWAACGSLEESPNTIRQHAA